MAFSNDVLVIGAPGDNNSTGAVYVWGVVGVSFQYKQKLTPPSSGPGSLFGSAVAFNSSFLFVGAPKAGAVYIFKLNDGAFTQEGSPKTGPIGSSFGISLAASSTLLVVGATTDNSTGIVYIYEMNSTTSSWTFQGHIEPNDINANDSFGHAVAVIDPNIIIVSKNPTHSPGSVYIFMYQGGDNATQTQKLVSAINATGDTFGNFLQATSNQLLIGSAGSESVYIYTYDGTTYSKTAILVASDASPGNHFGSQGSMFLSDTRFDITIAAANANSGNGEVYIFDALIVPLSETSTLVVNYNNGTFGSSLLFTDNTLVVGASTYDGNTGRSGAMLIYLVSSGSTLVSQFVTILVTLLLVFYLV